MDGGSCECPRSWSFASHRASVSGATRTSIGDASGVAEGADTAVPISSAIIRFSGSTGRNDRASARSSNDASLRARHSSQHAAGGPAIAPSSPVPMTTRASSAPRGVPMRGFRF